MHSAQRGSPCPSKKGSTSSRGPWKHTLPLLSRMTAGVGGAQAGMAVSEALWSGGCSQAVQCSPESAGAHVHSCLRRG